MLTFTPVKKSKQTHVFFLKFDSLKLGIIMPAKRKQNQSDWHECVACRCIVNYRDMTLHKNECNLGCENLTHGHIKDNIIFPVISDRSLTGTYSSAPIHLFGNGGGVLSFGGKKIPHTSKLGKKKTEIRNVAT